MELEYLPLGSVVKLQGGDAELMIIGRLPIMSNEEQSEALVYDYMACLDPVGVNVEEAYYFNQDDINEVVFEGYASKQEVEFQNKLAQWLVENDGKFQKGRVD